MLGTEDKKINNIVSFLKELTATGQCGGGEEWVISTTTTQAQGMEPSGRPVATETQS